MKLRMRLFSQYMLVLLCTVVITAVLSLVFGSFYIQFNRSPVYLGAESTELIVLRGKQPVYFGQTLSRAQAQEVIMNYEMGKSTIKLDGVPYSMAAEEMAEEGLRVIKLSPAPSLDSVGIYSGLIGFVIVVFFITFLIASFLSQRYYDRKIVRPVVALKAATDRLAGGELDIPVPDSGEDEIRDLGRAVETLRLKLKESVYYREKSDDNRKFLISSISHDLRTPVTSIRGYLEGILDGVADTPERQRKYLKAAHGKTALISAMIDDLLLYSKLDLQQIPFNMERVDIAAYMEDSVADNQLAFQSEDKGVSFAAGLAGPVYVAIDPQRFRRVIQNVLDNARKHIPNGTGEAVISLRETNSSVIIECRDNGSGIAKEELPHIFDRFYRADNAREAGGGSGLGLAIARQIVEGMDGRIWAVSEPGQGTSMMISLKKSKK